MTDRYVRTLGTVDDLDGTPCPVGVDYDTVALAGYRFPLDDLANLGQLLIEAIVLAGRHHAEMEAANRAAADQSAAWHDAAAGADPFAIPANRIGDQDTAEP
jgi:hypothetical protein